MSKLKIRKIGSASMDAAAGSIILDGIIAEVIDHLMQEPTHTGKVEAPA